MIFKLHYFFITSGINAIGILLGVYMETYTDASRSEIGLMLMLMPLLGIIFKPMICSLADRRQAHQKILINLMQVAAISYGPFVLIPIIGPDLYEQHARICFYVLLAFKVVGDTAFTAAYSLADSLAINYARRIGVDYSVYRVWGTISWMVFGLVIGHINEVWFLPKYVPAFMVLVGALLLDIFVVWLWPSEYFAMVAHTTSSAQTPKSEKSESKLSKMTKCLMPKEQVLAHMRRKLGSLFKSDEQTANNYGNNLQLAAAATQPNQTDLNSNKLERKQTEKKNINMRTQMRILKHIFKRDKRVSAYLILFTCCGFVLAPLSFFFMSLSNICRQNGSGCDFSQLSGFLQVAMALAEMILFLFIDKILAKIGRLNTVSIGFTLILIEFGFLATIWTQVSPYYSIGAMMLNGASFGIFLTLTVNMGHLFASEVQHVLPELISSGLIDEADEDQEKLKLALAATMQALTSNAMDGFGRGGGALVYGLMLDHFSYSTVWATVATVAFLALCLIESVNLFDSIFHFGPSKQVAAGAAAEEPSRLENVEIGVAPTCRKEKDTTSEISIRIKT